MTRKGFYMKRKLISWVTVISMLFLLCFTASAAEVSTGSPESEASDRIAQMVSQIYCDSPGQYALGNAVAIYNADTSCVYYTIPIFCNEEWIETIVD